MFPYKVSDFGQVHEVAWFGLGLMIYVFFMSRFVAEFRQTNSFKTKPEIFFSKNDTLFAGGFRNDTGDFSNSRISWDVY